MKTHIKFRKIRDGEEIEVCNLVARSFNEFIAPDFPEQGVEEFFLYSNPLSLKRRLEKNYFSMVAECDGRILGMIEIKGGNHISMLYVDKDFHHNGIASTLVKKALEEISENNRNPEDITVNSSRYAVPFYESLGFIQYEYEKSVYGVIHTPMLLSVDNVIKLKQ